MLVSSACFIFSCSSTAISDSPLESSKDLVSSSYSISFSKKPEWLDATFKRSNEYFHGFAQVEKIGSRQDYINECHNIALGNIAKQIESHVKIRSERKVMEIEKLGSESSYSIDKKFLVDAIVESDIILDRVENYGEWEDDRYYYVYKRLSITEYEKPLKNAIQSASMDLKDGYKYLIKDPIQALGYFFSAYRDLYPYQNQLLTTIDPIDTSRTINIGIETRSIIKSLIQSIEMVTDETTLEAIVGKPVKTPLKLLIYFNDDSGEKAPLKNAPISYYFVRGKGDLVISTKTDQSGKAVSTISKIRSPETHQIVKVTLDLGAFVGKDSVGRMILSEFDQAVVPYEMYELNVRQVIVYLDVEELILGSPINSPIVAPVLIKSLENQIGAKFSNEKQNTDYTLELRIDTEKLGELHGLFSAVSTINIYFKEGNSTLFANSMSGIRGIHSSYELASIEALKKLAEKVESELSTEIAKQFLE